MEPVVKKGILDTRPFGAKLTVDDISAKQVGAGCHACAQIFMFSVLWYLRCYVRAAWSCRTWFAHQPHTRWWLVVAVVANVLAGDPLAWVP